MPRPEKPEFTSFQVCLSNALVERHFYKWKQGGVRCFKLKLEMDEGSRWLQLRGAEQNEAKEMREQEGIIRRTRWTGVSWSLEVESVGEGKPVRCLREVCTMPVCRGRVAQGNEWSAARCSMQQQVIKNNVRELTQQHFDRRGASTAIFLTEVVYAESKIVQLGAFTWIMSSCSKVRPLA